MKYLVLRFLFHSKIEIVKLLPETIKAIKQHTNQYWTLFKM